MKVYNKLVRDKIPQIINSHEDEFCKTRVLDDNEYSKELHIKLQEEMKEYLDSQDIEELADIEEVLRTLLDLKNISYDEFEKIRMAKVEKRGAFKDKVFLEYVDKK